MNGYIRTVMSLSVCDGASAIVQTTGYHCGYPGHRISVGRSGMTPCYNGNIVRLKRRGKKNNNVYGTIDDLKMSQEGNQTVGVHEYDAWGNPRRIQFDNGNITEYVFTATGTKYAARDDAAYTMSACRLAHLISAHFIVVRPLGQKVRRELLPKAILQLLATTLSRG